MEGQNEECLNGEWLMVKRKNHKKSVQNKESNDRQGKTVMGNKGRKERLHAGKDMRIL